MLDPAIMNQDDPIPATDDIAPDRADMRRRGRRVQWATVVWNMGEVVVTIALGITAGSLALIAFGLDSLVEVFASLVVVWHMSARGDSRPVHRDRRALRLVAAAFAVLAVYLFVASIHSAVRREHADSSPIGIAYLAATALVMFILAGWKRTIGTKIGSEPFLAEASMTFLDGCLASGILTALALNTAFGWWWADPFAALIVSLFAAREALDAWRDAPAPAR